jgi:hypothetical protein
VRPWKFRALNICIMLITGSSVFNIYPWTTAVQGPTSKKPLAYKWYNAEEVILGKKMKVRFVNYALSDRSC